MDRLTATRDELLALRCQAGEPAAFAELIAAFERPLRYYLVKTLGDEDRAYDVLQEVWLKAEGIRAGELTPDASPRTCFSAASAHEG
jgi:DNA-directed RNA polymerase specialized sigma24 family protein